MRLYLQEDHNRNTHHDVLKKTAQLDIGTAPESLDAILQAGQV